MATLSTTFRAESARIHEEHQATIEELNELERGLDRLVCYSEVFADLRGANDVRERGWRLVRQLPEHCQREEAKVLDPVGEVSPELAEFCRQMKRAHGVLLARVRTFSSALEELENPVDIEATIRRVKEEGNSLTRELRRHLETEEHELSGFL